MSAPELPIMPFFIKDWIGATQHWTDAERGAYISLLCFQWLNGTIPADVQRLARIMGTPEGEFDARWATVGQKFDGDIEGLLNNRLEEHRKKTIGIHEAKVRGAQGTNAVRAAKKALRVASANAERNADGNGMRDAEGDAPRTHPYPYPYLESEKTVRTEEEEEEHEKEREKPEIRSANAERSSRGTFKNYWSDEKWIDAKLRYPNRAGGHNDRGAQHAWRARLREGHTWDELFGGMDRYHAYCVATGKVGTEFVMQRKTFCGPAKHFLEEWRVPEKVTPAATWRPPSDDPSEAA